MTDKLQHHELIAEWVTDSQGPGIMLTQSAAGYCEPETVMLHPWQLRAVCEQFGLIASDQQAAKTIAALTRRLLVMRERIDHLAHWLANHSDSKHADLSYEQTYATATADIAGEFCADFEGQVTASVFDADNAQSEGGKIAPTTASPSTNPRQLAMEV